MQGSPSFFLTAPGSWGSSNAGIAVAGAVEGAVEGAAGAPGRPWAGVRRK